MKLNPANIYQDFSAWVARTPQAPAIITPHSTLSYHDLEQAIIQQINLLHADGLRARHTAALIVSDELVSIVVVLALARMGVTLCCVPRATPIEQQQQWIAQVHCDILISDSADTLSAHAACTAGILVDAHGVTKKQSCQENPPAIIDDTPTRPLMIVIGSGSTGRNKIMAISHPQMRARVQSMTEIYQLSSTDRIATMAHMEYSSGVHRLWNALTLGAAFVLFDRNYDSIQRLHTTWGVTLLSGTVFHAQQLLHRWRGSRERPLAGIKLVITSSIVSDALRQEIQSCLSTDLWVIYGSNETWTLTAADPDACRLHPGTVGRAVPGVELQIVDNHFRPLASGQIGHIAVRGDQIIDHYLNDPESTTRYMRNGWFLPGDLGKQLDDGHLIFCGRSDNMMILNGVNIYPIEIEQCLMTHPEVTDVVALPLRHQVHQDLPVALVALAPHATSNEAQLLAFATERLGFKHPRRIFVCSAIPRNAQGKPIKAAMQSIIHNALTSDKVTSHSPKARE